MPSPIKPCSICNSPIRAELERRILAGETARSISDETQCSRRQLLNHFRRGHVAKYKKPVNIDTATEMRKRVEGTVEGPAAPEGAMTSAMASLIEQTSQVMANMTRMYDEAIANGQHSMALNAAQKQINALKGIREMLETAAKASGEYDQKAMNLYVLPEWKEVLVILVNTLQPYPDAREAVINALRARVTRSNAQVPELEAL